MKIDRQKSFNDFVETVEQGLVEVEKLINANNENKQSLEYISQVIVPRLSQRPAVFSDIKSMQECTALNEGDYCMLFTRPEDSPNIFIKVYQVKDINFREDRKITLFDKNLAAFEVKQSESDIEVVNDLVSGGTFKALSAEQGKVLLEKINKFIEEIKQNLESQSELVNEKLTENEKATNEKITNLENSVSQEFTKQNQNISNQFAEQNNNIKTEFTNINKNLSSIGGRLKVLEEAVYNDITGNPFLISFKDIDGIVLTNGIFNENKAILEC